LGFEAQRDMGVRSHPERRKRESKSLWVGEACLGCYA